MSNLKLEITPKSPEYCKNSYHLFQLKVSKKKSGISRDQLINKLHSKNIGTGVHYLSIPSHKFYKEKFNWKNNDYPNASLIGDRTLSIPLSPYLKNNEINYIADQIKNILR